MGWREAIADIADQMAAEEPLDKVDMRPYVKMIRLVLQTASDDQSPAGVPPAGRARIFGVPNNIPSPEEIKRREQMRERQKAEDIVTSTQTGGTRTTVFKGGTLDGVMAPLADGAPAGAKVHMEGQVYVFDGKS